MFAYRHQFHAGNFADVFKHALLTRLLLALAIKPKPFCYVDTHAGIGAYDLNHSWAQQNAEFRDGIERIWSRQDQPALLTPYLDAIRVLNPQGALRWYPGSPLIARGILRSADRAVLSEMNREDFAQLKETFDRTRHTSVLQMDGYASLKAHLPPNERRGLVLIDSSFDRSGEFARLTQALLESHRRWATGVYVIWYPLMTPGAIQAFGRALVATGIRKILNCVLEVHAEDWRGSLRGCGVLVVNPPFGFEREARTIGDYLAPHLAQSFSAASVRWLVPE